MRPKKPQLTLPDVVIPRSVGNMMIAVGTKLGRYETRAKIGEGGMGEVYLAQDTKLDRKVALKILPAELAAVKQSVIIFET